MPNSIYRGKNGWVRPNGLFESWQGYTQLSAVNLGPRIFALDTNRGEIDGTSVYANAIRYRNASYFAVADTANRQVYINEAASFVTSATANKLTVNIGANTYNAGLSTPSLPTVTPIAGGTKSMDGLNSVRLVAKRTTTQALSNPTEAVEVTFSAGVTDLCQITFPAAVSGQDAWVVYATEMASGRFGPWKEVNYLNAGVKRYEIPETVVAAAPSRQVNFEWRNQELGRLCSFTNFPPPLARGVLSFNDILVLWGCYGGTSDAAPGPYLQPMKSNNPEGCDPGASVPTTNQEDILNVVPGEGRLYVLTSNSLQIATYTGQDAPFLMRMVWGTGFASPLAAVFANQSLYTFCKNGAIRTRANDEPDQIFAADVGVHTREWVPANVVLGHDPRNAAVIYYHYYDPVNFAGHPWVNTTMALPYMLQQGIWSPPMQITGQVTSCATNNGVHQFILLSGGTYRVNTWDSGQTSVSWYACTPYDDAGYEEVDKVVTQWNVTSKANSIGIYTNLADMEATSPVSTQPLSGNEVHEPPWKCQIKLAKSFAFKVSGTAAKQHVHEICAKGWVSLVPR